MTNNHSILGLTYKDFAMLLSQQNFKSFKRTMHKKVTRTFKYPKMFKNIDRQLNWIYK